MNLAYRDIKHNLLRFVLTNFGLSLLLGIDEGTSAVKAILFDADLRPVRACVRGSWMSAAVVAPRGRGSG